LKYKIVIEKKAVKFIKKQTPEQQKRILKAINNLPNGDIKSIQGYTGYYRLRVGNYRIIYTIDNEVLTIIVTNIGNRGQIYNSL